jgi:hypothetical protein
VTRAIEDLGDRPPKVTALQQRQLAAARRELKLPPR